MARNGGNHSERPAPDALSQPKAPPLAETACVWTCLQGEVDELLGGDLSGVVNPVAIVGATRLPESLAGEGTGYRGVEVGGVTKLAPRAREEPSNAALRLVSSVIGPVLLLSMVRDMLSVWMRYSACAAPFT